MIAMVVDDRTTVGDAIAIVDYLIRLSAESCLTSTWRFPVKAYVGIQYLELWNDEVELLRAADLPQ